MWGLIPEEIEVKAAMAALKLRYSVYRKRSGIGVNIPMSDEQIRESELNVARDVARRQCKDEPPDQWFVQESKWAIMVLGLEQAIADDFSHPDHAGRWTADGYRDHIRASVMEVNDVPIDTDGLTDELMDDGRVILAGERVFGCHPPGPVFREAFLARYRQIVDEEIGVCGQTKL